MSTFGDQVLEYGGSPVSGGRFTNPWGTHYFVDGTDGADRNDGKAPNRAKATIQAAVTAATGGDVIYIRAQTYKIATGFNRYTEDVTITQGGTAGSGQVATNANMAIIGVTPRSYPSDMLGVRTKYATAAHGGWLIYAPGTHIEGIGVFAEDATTSAVHFLSETASYTSTTDGSSLYNVMIKGKQLRLAGGGGDIAIVNCKFQCKYNGTGTPQIEVVGGANRLSIVGCDFIGGNVNNYATPPIVTAAPLTSFVMRDCHFSQDPDAGDFLDINGTTNSGVVTNCYFGSEDVTAKLADLTSGSSGIHSAGIYDENGCDDMS